MAVITACVAVGAFADCTPRWRGLSYGYTQVEYVVATDDAVKGKHSCETVRLARSGNRNDDGKGVAFVNCLFSDNELDGNVDNQAEVVLDNKADAWFSFALKEGDRPCLKGRGRPCLGGRGTVPVWRT